MGENNIKDLQRYPNMSIICLWDWCSREGHEPGWSRLKPSQLPQHLSWLLMWWDMVNASGVIITPDIITPTQMWFLFLMWLHLWHNLDDKKTTEFFCKFQQKLLLNIISCRNPKPLNAIWWVCGSSTSHVNEKSVERWEKLSLGLLTTNSCYSFQSLVSP